MMHFDAETVALSGMNLIEASAGTGKTYTLAELYLRLVLEQNLKVEQILVVTYTRAATEELRDRLRQKLADKRQQLLKQKSADKQALDTLALAIQSFDQAAIYTIHSFCQRVLTDYAFESGLDFDVDLIGDERELLQAATDDFWRCNVNEATPEFAAYLLAKHQTPESLLQSIRGLIGKPYLNYLELPESDVDKAQDAVMQQFELVKKTWNTEQDQVIATLQNKALLNGNKYRVSSVDKWLLQLMALLEQTSLPATLFDDFNRFTPEKLEDALKKDQVLPELTFWTACESLLERYQQLELARTIQLQHLRLSLLAYLNDKVPALKQQQQVQSYDDLLINLEHALSTEHSEQLVALLRDNYRAALIDEFQDTDPVQYQSFRRIYQNSGLPTFFVGDPKQAIYSFRGADIFTYLTAKSATEHEHTLDKNWRSHPDLVAAVNALFQRQDSPFIYDDIPFHAVAAARPSEVALATEQTDHAPLQLVWASTDKAMTKGDMMQLAANSTADQIAQLLNLAQNHQATVIEDKQQRALSGGDIAVLVRNHIQASAMQQCLLQRGINSVQQGRATIFASDQAVMMERLLLAVAEPNHVARVTTVLASPFFGLTADALYHCQQDQQQWLPYLDLFYELHQLWLKKGFMSMFRHVMVTQAVQQRLLALQQGERQLTNLYHLAELIQDYCQRQKSAIDSVITWLSSHRASVDGDDETAQLRLESDEHLVKIITIHKSKGLEYPIVFCPFLWHVKSRKDSGELVQFHDPEHDNAAYVAMAEPALTKAKQVFEQEQQAEELRLLYVALTRARERCVICWGTVADVTKSALFSLLHPERDGIDATNMTEDLHQLVAQKQSLFSITDLVEQPAITLNKPQDNEVQLQSRDFTGHIRKPWRIGSFSALTAGHDAELPDYDGASYSEMTLELELKPQIRRDRFGFPRGAQAGTCLHRMLEVWDFSQAYDDASRSQMSRILAQYGFDQSWTDVVCQWLSEIVATPLLADHDFCLADLKPAQRIDEMAFYFPVDHLSVTSLKKQLQPYLTDNPLLKHVIDRLAFYDLKGFMKGFIDMVFEHQGRFYVVDYKSNFLGDKQQDYQQTQLDDAMLSHDYPLQYLIYSLALHRYLRLRLPNYDPVQHLGGVLYLFIRGMHPDWHQSGVFSDQINSDLIEALDRYMQGQSS
ncbi:MAG: exodeoxyribonuclease V subunit beta [Gammaproteobacteria bacterium]|nr:exodeoxyribonuclease V subunit beta [Gammaproteobacteria bacterium]